MLPDKLFYNIREVSAHFGVAPSLLRYWEKEFPYLATKRNARGVRFYTKQNIADLQVLYELVKKKGYTLEGARFQLKKPDASGSPDPGLKQTLLEVKEILVKFKHALHEMG